VASVVFIHKMPVESAPSPDVRAKDVTQHCQKSPERQNHLEGLAPLEGSFSN
jgi:hypothetical protein